MPFQIFYETHISQLGLVFTWLWIEIIVGFERRKKLRTGRELGGSYSSPVQKIFEAVLGLFTTIKTYTAQLKSDLHCHWSGRWKIKLLTQWSQWKVEILHFEKKIVNVVIGFCPIHKLKVWTKRDLNTRRCKKQHYVKDSGINSAIYRYNNTWVKKQPTPVKLLSSKTSLMTKYK